ncbi:hypothetical protein D3C81_1769510 [compost metagenome]
MASMASADYAELALSCLREPAARGARRLLWFQRYLLAVCRIFGVSGGLFMVTGCGRGSDYLRSQPQAVPPL